MRKSLQLFFPLTIFTLAIVTAPLLVSAQGVDTPEVQTSCWTEAQCSDAGGVWGLSATYRDRWGQGRVDSWSEKYCNPIILPTARCFSEQPENIKLQIGIPGLRTSQCEGGGMCFKGGFPVYFAAFFKFFVALMAIVSVVMIMWGGFKRIMAAGSSETIGAANKTIFGAISGLVLTLVSYSLLNLINPRLTANSFPALPMVKPDYMAGEYCPDYNTSSGSYQNGYYDVTKTCVGGTRGGQICQQDSQCTGGGTCANSSGELRTSDPGETCGRALIVSGKQCLGVTCESHGQGCFPVYDDSGGAIKGRYGCANALLTANFPPGLAFRFNLAYVCNRHGTSGYNEAGFAYPNNSTRQSGFSIKSTGTFFVISPPLSSGTNTPDWVCRNNGGVKGYVLIIARNHALNKYALGSAACAGTTAPLADGSGNLHPGLVITSYDWDTIPSASLLQFRDGQNPIQCNPNIPDTAFPD